MWTFKYEYSEYIILAAAGASAESLRDDHVLNTYDLLREEFPNELWKTLWIRAGGTFDRPCSDTVHRHILKEMNKPLCFVCGVALA